MPDTEVLLQALQQPHWQERAKAAEALGGRKQPSPQVVSALLTATEDAQEEVRKQAEGALIFLVLPLVQQAVRKTYRWLEDNVAGCPRNSATWREHAEYLTVMLVLGQCYLKRHCQASQKVCQAQHHLAAWDSASQKLESYIYRAVIGPTGQFMTNSLAQGMLFPELGMDWQLRVGLVEFKQCAQCGRLYEGGSCPYDDSPFAPTTTRVIGKDWVVLEQVYLPVRRWRCGEGRSAHYYVQDHCREVEEEYQDRYPDVSYHTVHFVHAALPRAGHACKEHDYCPLSEHAQSHPQRGTALWIRAQFTGDLVADFPTSPAPLPGLMQGVVEGMQRALEVIEGWKRALLFFLAREHRQGRPLEEPWQALLQGGGQLGEAELIDLAETLLWSAPRGSEALSFQELLQQLSAHRDEIAQGLGLPPFEVPSTVQRVYQALSQDIVPRTQAAIRQALQARGIEQEMLQTWLQDIQDGASHWGEELLGGGVER